MGLTEVFGSVVGAGVVTADILVTGGMWTAWNVVAAGAGAMYGAITAHYWFSK